MKIKLFVAREIQYFEVRFFSFNSYIYSLTRGFIASTRVFNLLTRPFNLSTGAFSLPTRALNLASRAFRVVTREFELVTRRFELVTRRFELVTREFELATCGFEFVTRRFELVTRGFQLITRNWCFTFPQIEHPIDWSQDRCCICTFPLEINPMLFDADEKTMSYADFIVFKEHKFLKNIFSNKELAKTDNMKDVNTYHKNFVRFLEIVVLLKNAFNTCDELDECFNDDLLHCKNHYADKKSCLLVELQPFCEMPSACG